MTNSGNHISPERTVVTIAEAAQIASCDRFELLRSAALQKIHVFVSVPQEVEVYSIDKRILGLENTDKEILKTKLERDRLIEIEPISCPDIDFLPLTPEDCTNILKRGVIRKSVFYTAIRFDTESKLQVINPPINKEPFYSVIKPISSPLYQCFAISTKAEQIDNQNNTRNFICNELEIRIENLNMIKDDINNILQIIPNLPNTPEETSSVIEIKSSQSSSRRLLVLRIAAKKFWEPIYSDNGSSDYPSEQDVIKYLTESKIAEFSETLAMRGASIMRPVYAKGKPDKAAQENRQSYISKELKILIVVSEAQFLDKPNNRPSKKSIANILIDLGLKEHKADAGASIIYPDDDDDDDDDEGK